MPVIKDSRLLQDGWCHLDDGEALPPEPLAVTVSLARWHGDQAPLRARLGPLGLRLGAGDLAGQVGEAAHRFELITIAFPAFTDGRGYSTARLLRGRYGYQGELRAVGHVLRDQFFFLHRVGFDAVEVRDDQIAQWAEALAEISVVYQPAQDRRTSVPHARWQPAAAAE